MQPRVAIIILNYNNWEDTIECMESLLKIEYSNFSITLVDNASTNQSTEHIVSWIKGEIKTSIKNIELSHLTKPFEKKPLPYRLISKNHQSNSTPLTQESTKPLITIIQSPNNNGYSAGNNIGIKHALTTTDPKYIWLLNNDTVAEKGALQALVRTFEDQEAEHIGIIGAKLKYYYSPEKIQAIGGKFNKWFATSRHIGDGEADNGQYDIHISEQSIDYPVGASLFIRREFISDIGLMCEDYFLYYEELDWTLRGQKLGWSVGYCPEAIIYHKEGGSIGSSSTPKNRSETSEYYTLRSRLIFSRKYLTRYLPSICAGFFLVIANRIKRRQLSRVPLVIRAFFDGWRWR